jgi:predicted acyl esterase
MRPSLTHANGRKLLRATRRPLGEVPADARQYAVRMPDGVRLATDVYLPKPDRPRPTLLCRLPYDKCGSECFIPAVARWFAERGYAVVAQDVRGKARSDGSLAPFSAEVADGYNTLEWCSNQPWCSGWIGMFGDSYYGFTQWAAASSGHPSLQAIAPRVSIADMAYALELHSAFRLETTAYWCLETWVDDGLYDYEGALNWDIRPLCEIVPEVLGGLCPVGLDDYALGRIPTSAKVPVTGRIPAIHLGGLFDFLLAGQLDTWRRARACTQARQALVLDATDHGWTELREPGEPYRDPATSAIAMERFLERYLQPLGEFFDQVLRGQADRAMPAVRWRLARGDGRWLNDRDWPPAGSEPIEWALAAGRSQPEGTLCTRVPRRHAPAGWVHDPVDPVPSLVHPYFPLVEAPDERDLHRRADICSFSTDPLSADLDLVGPVELCATLTASCATAHLVATLYDVFADGGAYRILDAAMLARAPWPARVTLRLGDTAYRVRASHRLRLVLAGSSFPRYILHPGTAEHPWGAVATKPLDLQVALGGADAATLKAHRLIKPQPRHT